MRACERLAGRGVRDYAADASAPQQCQRQRVGGRLLHAIEWLVDRSDAIGAGGDQLVARRAAAWVAHQVDALAQSLAGQQGRKVALAQLELPLQSQEADPCPGLLVDDVEGE